MVLRSAPKHPRNVMRNITEPTTINSRAGSTVRVSTTSIHTHSICSSMFVDIMDFQDPYPDLKMIITRTRNPSPWKISFKVFSKVKTWLNVLAYLLLAELKPDSKMDPGTQKVILGILEKSFTKSASVFWPGLNPSCFPEVCERANIHLDISDNTRASKRWNMSEELRGSSSGMWSTSLVLISWHSYTVVIPGHSTDLETFTIHKTNLCSISLNLHKVTVWTVL